MTKGSFQGFAGGPSFSDDSRYLFVPTQEGYTGVMRIDLQSEQSNVLSYACNNAIYNNPRKSAQFGGYVACNNTITPWVQVLNGGTMATANSRWPASIGGVSQAVQIDKTYVYLAHDGSPGFVTATDIQTGKTYEFKSTDKWQGVYCMEIDHANNLLVCCDNNTGKLYLFAVPTAAAPGAPRLLATLPGQHVGVPNGNRLYVANGQTIRTYDITNRATPVPLGGASTYTSGHAAYDQIKLDRARGYLYLPWGNTTATGTDVIAIDGTTGALSLKATIPGWKQSGPGGEVYCPANDCAVSPDSTKFAVSSEGGGGGNGGTIVYDVSRIPAGGQAAVIKICYSNSETRQATLVAGDPAAYVYSVCRYSYEVHDANNTLILTGAVGGLIGDTLRPFGTTAGGTDPTLFLSPGWGEYLFRCSKGVLTPVLSYGNATLLNTAWDGKYLSAVVNGYGTLKLVIYSVGAGPSYALTPVATYTGASGAQGTNGICVDGAVGAPGSVLWVSDTALGLMAFDVGRVGVITPIARGDIPDRLVAKEVGPPTATAVAGGKVESPWNYQFMLAYFDAFGVCCGASALSATVAVTEGSKQVILSGLPKAPADAKTLTAYGTYTYIGATNTFGPGRVPEATGLPVSAARVSITSPHATWFGGPPNLRSGSYIPAAGGICEIRAASGRIYLAQGDLGVRVYDKSTMRRTGQITATGDSNVHNNPLAAPGIDVYKDAAGAVWLMVPNYTASGGHSGLVALNTTANPDNPPATFIPTTVAGFTCRTYQTAVGGPDAGVLMATLSGGICFQRS